MKSLSHPCVPKVLYIGEGTPELKTTAPYAGIATELNVKYLSDEVDIEKTLHEFNPDSIITITKNQLEEFPTLCSLSGEFRDRWYVMEEPTKDMGDIAYRVAMNDILNADKSELVSWVTSIYNTGNMLYRTYESLRNQTNVNWEWVLSNDSTDDGETIKIAEDIASNDPRVKIFDFNTKSGGIIGEAKYRAMCLAEGGILAEFDHDDYVTPDATQLLLDAKNAFPDAGFYYTDSCEVDMNWNSLVSYSGGFNAGYGKYHKEIVLGREFDSIISAGINPKTIRHIVGIPNHIRAWRRDVYHAIGGHNRKLAVADDYELVVRTFLNTLMVKIPKLAYLQFIYNSGDAINTHEIARQDIQRRVATIMYNYNDDIAKRFDELGVEDWAYKENPSNPFSVASRRGAEEGAVNYTLEL